MKGPGSTPAEAAPARTRVLRIVSSDAPRAGEEIPVAGRLTIGRDGACDIVLADPSVSRRHAAVEPVAEGLEVTDLGSGNGVWVGSERVGRMVLASGQRFQVGSTVFECVVPAPAAAAAGLEAASMLDAPTVFMPAPAPSGPSHASAGPVAHPPFVLRFVEGARSGTEIEVGSGAATIGRSPDCTVVIQERDVSRRHARIESTPDGFVVTDTGSSFGVWVGSKQVASHVLKPGEPFRLSPSVVLDCRFLEPAGIPLRASAPESPDATVYVPATGLSPEPSLEAAAPFLVPRGAPAATSPAAPTAGVTEDDFSQTIVMPAPVLQPETRGIETEGELIDFLAHKPILLDDPRHVWYVVSGGVLIFTVAVEGGQPVGTRTHFLGITAGQCFFGFDIASYGLGSGFLAVAKQGTQVRRITRDRFRELADLPGQRALVAGLVDAWVGGLSSALVAGLPLKRKGELALKAGEQVEVGPSTRATAAGGVAWIEISSGSIMFDGMATPAFERRRTLFPLTPAAWIQPLGDEFGPLVVTPVPTTEALDKPLAWMGLDVFHGVLCECEFINKKLATVDEFVRLEQKAQQSLAAAEAGYDAIGSVLRTEAATPQEFRATGATEPVFRACKLVGDALGIEIRDQPPTDDELQLPFEDRVNVVASTSGFRTRVVALRDTWWARDQGPMLGQLAATKQPVALLPAGPGAYRVVDATIGAARPVTAESAATLSAFAHAFYRPLPEGLLEVWDVVKFGARGLSGDMKWVASMAVVVGLFGTVTPLLTGKVFDTAIPQADRNVLFVFGAALLASAIGTALFNFTQGIATVRIQARMASSIQASVWDRMMNLPVSFFRKFSAGDLSDRAGGVDAIQELIAGAGVAAVLGSVSGLFYIVQMFSYDLRLALLAIGLTATYVGVNMACNYMQLRYQRSEFQLRGRITGLVLNLVTGVSKLRICGAEQHAFRVWAEQFAQQRKIAFTVGSIQNGAMVFGMAFPVLSSVAIFLTVISEQTRMAAANQPGLTTGDFIAFNAAFGLFLGAMQSLGDASLNLLRVVPIYERLMPILTTAPEVDRSKAFPGRLTGEIELSHLHFRYDPEGPFIVKDVSLRIKPGEFVAFVGPSGCGKSTLMRLMLGFEQPTSGSIYYDGQDLPSLDLRMVRQQMGVVMQQSRVMPTEIYRNIVGATSRSIEEAWEAAEKSGLAEDIRNMPMGMHTYVSEGGGTLSGGQRQRLMIARAIVNKPKIIFLDEATSALDNRTQSIVTESMDKMSATRIVIAHRLSTIINADRICYLQSGQIAEMGSYQELMAKNGLFAELARRQMA